MNNKALHVKAQAIKAVVFDGFGVFFSERVFVEPGRGEVLAERSHADGQGISFLRAAGILVGFASSEKTGFFETVGEKLNNLPSVKEGRWKPIELFTGDRAKDKVASVGAWLEQNSISWEECAYMGDDIGDYKIIQKVGFRGAPAQAEEIIKNLADYIAPRRGGDGAVRDFCNFILKAKGIDVTTLPLR